MPNKYQFKIFKNDVSMVQGREYKPGSAFVAFANPSVLMTEYNLASAAMGGKDPAAIVSAVNIKEFDVTFLKMKGPANSCVSAAAYVLERSGIHKYRVGEVGGVVLENGYPLNDSGEIDLELPPSVIATRKGKILRANLGYQFIPDSQFIVYDEDKPSEIARIVGIMKEMTQAEQKVVNFNPISSEAAQIYMKRGPYEAGMFVDITPLPILLGAEKN